MTGELSLHDTDAMIDRLRSGGALIAPLPSPLAYVVVATEADAVNATKARPSGQGVGLGLRDVEVVSPFLDVPARVVELIAWLCDDELVSVLAPAAPPAPAWTAPAIRDGQLFFATAWLPALAPVMRQFGHLYMSSANTTGSAPAVTAAEATAAFARTDVPVVDGDVARDRDTPHGSTTMVRVDAGGVMRVHRAGVNDAAFDGDAAAYTADLARRFAASG